MLREEGVIHGLDHDFLFFLSPPNPPIFKDVHNLLRCTCTFNRYVWLSKYGMAALELLNILPCHWRMLHRIIAGDTLRVGQSERLNSYLVNLSHHTIFAQSILQAFDLVPLGYHTQCHQQKFVGVLVGG